MTTTFGSAKWQGGIKDGKGAISTKSGALKDYPYGFASRFEGKPGSNPEELIGAAHAACFTMALSLILGEAKLTAEQMETKADVTLEKVGDGFAITSVHLTLNAKIPGADKAKFEELAGMAKAGCPVSKLLEHQDHAGRDAALAASFRARRRPRESRSCGARFRVGARAPRNDDVDLTYPRRCRSRQRRCAPCWWCRGCRAARRRR